MKYDVVVDWTPEDGTILTVPELKIEIKSKITQVAIMELKQELRKIKVC